MAKINTNAVRAFQQKVYAMSRSNQKEIKLTAIEAQALSHELSQLTALILEQQDNSTQLSDIQVEISAKKF